MVRKKRGSSSFFAGLGGCGCGDSKSVSVSDSSDIIIKSAVVTSTTPSRVKNNLSSTTDTLTPTITSASTSSPWDDDDADCKFDSSSSTPSFSGLLRELSELEQTVMSWRSHKPEKEKEKEKEKKIETKKPVAKGHKRSMSEGGMRMLEESVVVVKESDDPLGDFRRSMLQMIVEKEIVDKEELCELLRQFLALNAPENHHLILQAFAEIWEEIFADQHGQRSPPEFVTPHARHRYPSPLRF